MSDLVRASSARKKGGFSRGQKLVLVGILAINLLIFGGMWLISQGSSPAERSTPSGGESLELEAAYKQALAQALDWAGDVQLVGVTASWQLASGDRLTMGRPAWAFQFYSPAKHQVGAVMVDLKGAQLGRRQTVNVAPQPVVPDWSLGGDELILTFMGHGGQDFMAFHPGANVHVQLKGEGENRPIWYVSAVDPVARQSMIIGIDAFSREVVFRSNTKGGK